MERKSLLVNGCIPAGQDCPFREGCTFAAQKQCNHTGEKHPVAFSCATARALDMFVKPRKA